MWRLAILLLFVGFPAWAQFAGNVGGLDSGPITASATPANSSHSAGTSIGGLFTLNLARVSTNPTGGGSGILTNLYYKSNGGSTGQLVVRIWAKKPANTTCTDNTAFAGSDTDDQFLLQTPQTMTPAAPGVTTGDSATYASLPGLTYDYKNGDTTPGTSIYLCAITVNTDTADENKVVRWYVSGPQN